MMFNHLLFIYIPTSISWQYNSYILLRKDVDKLLLMISKHP